MAISHAALLDELVKIAEETSPPKKEGLGRALRAMGTAAAGGAIGYGGAELLARKSRFFHPPPALMTEAQKHTFDNRVRAARIILPILSGAAVMLADRYRQRLNEEYGKTRGYEGKK